MTPRQKAASKGEKTYYSGKPCKYGHLDMRDTANGLCVICRRAMNREVRQRIQSALKKARGEK